MKRLVREPKSQREISGHYAPPFARAASESDSLPLARRPAIGNTTGRMHRHAGISSRLDGGFGGRRRFVNAVCPTLIAICLCGGASAQTAPWLLFIDDPTASAAACDVVNAAGEQLIVRTDSGALEGVNDNPIPLSGTVGAVPSSVVDAVGVEAYVVADVFFDNLPFGFLAFAGDSNGRRVVWWLVDVGGLLRVVDVGAATRQPQASARGPGQVSESVCDACDVLRDVDLCGCFDDANCDDLNPCTDDVCLVSGACASFNVEAACDDGDPCTEADLCSGGTCAGVAVEDCEDDPDSEQPPIIPRITVSFCGGGASGAVILALFGLLSFNLVRGRAAHP